MWSLHVFFAPAHQHVPFRLIYLSTQELDLGDADTDIITLDDLSMSQLGGLGPTNLRRLSLSRCRWVSSCEPLKGLSKLQVLDLSHTDVGPRALEALAELPDLHTLNLTGCRCVFVECWFVAFE